MSRRIPVEVLEVVGAVGIWGWEEEEHAKTDSLSSVSSEDSSLDSLVYSDSEDSESDHEPWIECVPSDSAIGNEHDDDEWVQI